MADQFFASSLRSADADVDGEYRYTLLRRWREGPQVCWVMLNPSTADAFEDDPTIRRCISFSKREGFGGLVVVNLFARRCTRPVHLKDPGDPVGPRNDKSTWQAIAASHDVYAAWGACPLAVQRAGTVKAYAEACGLDVWCLGTTKAGAPKHPLYVKGDAELVRWP